MCCVPASFNNAIHHLAGRRHLVVSHTLRIRAELNQLAAARQFVEDTGARLGLPSAVTHPLILAVDESLSNIIQHGYNGQPGTIDIEIERALDLLVVRLRDQAPPFDPTHLPDPNTQLPLNQRPVGGMGVFLTRRSVDGVTYERMPEGGNQLTLTKKIGPG
jgi:serine/threonine-protein kinase RsbW